MMQIPDSIFIAVVGAFVAIIPLVVFAKNKSKRTTARPRPLSSGPSNVRFECAGCSQQFTHTKRTVAAWEKGTRRFFCNTCHKKWRDSHPPQESQAVRPAYSHDQTLQPPVVSSSRNSTCTGGFAQPNTRTSNVPRESRSGCLGVAVLFVVLPVILFVAIHA